MIKAILFDMDGTLVDTEPVGPAVMRNFFSKHSINITDDEWQLFDKVWRRDGAKMTFEEYMTDVFKRYSPNVDIDKIIEEFYTDYEGAISFAKQLPGADKLLKSLRNKFKIALVTASTDFQAKEVLENNKWTSLFDLVVSHDDFEKSKPNPESFLTACSKLGLKPTECIVIEDSKNGVLAGKNAGMFVIGVRAGNKHPQDISKANLIVETLEDIKI